jgi:hypothetical protein
MTARERVAGTVANYVDERTGAAKWVKKNLTKVFPDHWSFLLGEIALYSFIILLLSGTFLTFWFDPSAREVIYDGSYAPLQGLHMSAAYESTLHISFEVRGGLLMRQIHHWSALIFMAAIVVHLMRVYFTGAFRKPREFNWIIGVGLLTLGIVEGFLGYSLPDDSAFRNRYPNCRGDYSSNPCGGFLLVILRFWRSLPWRSIYSTYLYRSRVVAAGNFPCANHGALNVGLVSEAHSVGRPR